MLLCRDASGGSCAGGDEKDHPHCEGNAHTEQGRPGGVPAATKRQRGDRDGLRHVSELRRGLVSAESLSTGPWLDVLIEEMTGPAVAAAADRCTGPTGEIAFFNIESEVEIVDS